MKKQLQILAATFLTVAIILCNRQEIEMPVTTNNNAEEILIQKWTNKVSGISETTNWGSARITIAPVDLSQHHFEVRYDGDEIRIYKDGVYMNSIY